MKKLLCWLFGHRLPQGWSGSTWPAYFTAGWITVDGIDRHHLALHADCPRCGCRYHAGNVHIPARYVIAENEMKRVYNDRAKRARAKAARLKRAS